VSEQASLQLAKARSWSRRAPLFVIFAAAFGHASQYFDVFCDDAFIALRYAKHLIERHELAYNLGQRVEGFTSPLWVLLVSAAGSLGLHLPGTTRLLGASAQALTFWALCRFWDELEPQAPRLALVPAAALAMSAPFAAWTFSGLETPLFTALFTLSLALLARDARKPQLRTSLQAGLSVALCVLCRPEGATLIVIGSVAICLPAGGWPEKRWRRLLAWLSPIAVLVGGYELFRLRYFGYPLPNTFYVKTSGEGLWQRGLGYLGFAGSEFGWLLVALCALSFAYSLLSELRRHDAPGSRSRRVLLLCTSVATVVHLLYVARVGGDFLDLYRFLVPLLPAAFCVATQVAYRLFLLTAGPARFAVPLLGACVLLVHGRNQMAMSREARQVSASSRAALRLEPLGWTRLYARRWRGIGRWLARVRVERDSTAVGAAGALPFHAELPNLDLFGLNDLEIARHGRIIGNRPGHQRFATADYLLARKPTFIFMNPESTPLTSQRLRYDRYWLSQGYLPIEIRVDPELCSEPQKDERARRDDAAGSCPEAFYHQFLVRRERADSLRGRADVVVGSWPR
jgi:arabinofuranosyltransferase